MRRFLLLLALAACSPEPPAVPPPPAPAPAPPASSPASSLAPVEPPAPPADPFALPGDLERLSPPEPAIVPFDYKLPAVPRRASAVPPRCAALARARPARGADCGSREKALSALAAALELDEARRDEALVALESCRELHRPLVRALRAAHAPRGCAEALVTPVLAPDSSESGHKPGSEDAERERVRGALKNVFMGQIIASRVERLREAVPMPAIGQAASLEQIRMFVRDRLPPWIKLRLDALSEAEASVGQLPGDSYGLALATSALGLAYADLVREFRAAPIPAELKKDGDLRGAYHTALDEASAPIQRKASLTLAEAGALWSRQGVLHDKEASAVFQALARTNRALMGWQDELLLPPVPAPGASAEERVAARVPVFASGILFAQTRRPEILRALLASGLPASVLKGLEEPQTSPEALKLAAAGRVLLGLRWREGRHLDEALRALGALPAGRRAPDERLWMALALSLRRGLSTLPRDLSSAPPPVVPTEALEALANASPADPWSALALADLVVVFDQFPPQGSGDRIEFHRQQAARLAAALALLPDEAQKKRVKVRLEERGDIVRFLEQSR